MTPAARIALKLACFVGLSLFIHVMILLGISLPPAWESTASAPLAVRLEPSTPAPVVAARRPQQKAKSPARPMAPPVAATPSPSMPEQAVMGATEPAQLAPPGTAVGEAADLPATPQAEDSGEKSAAPETPAAVPAVTGPEIPSPTPRANVAQLPQKGQIDYVLYYGTNRVRVGRTRQTWEIQDGRYRLSSISETTGLVWLFVRRERIVYESRGRLTVAGLQPDTFTTQRTRSGKTESAGADFDWQAMNVSLGNPRQTAPLPTSTQDLLSLMYQVGLMELMPGRIQLPITNGWKLERYDLEIGPQDTLQTPMGDILAVPLTQVRRPGQGSIELWLAPAYRLLPVRIRFFDREGAPSGEQLVTDIRVSEK